MGNIPFRKWLHLRHPIMPTFGMLILTRVMCRYNTYILYYIYILDICNFILMYKNVVNWMPIAVLLFIQKPFQPQYECRSFEQNAACIVHLFWSLCVVTTTFSAKGKDQSQYIHLLHPSTDILCAHKFVSALLGLLGL